MFDERVTSECYAQINTYAAIHTVVRSHPRFHSRTSSTRSCSQNTGPMMETKRLKLTDIVGSDSDSREDIYTGSSIRRTAPVLAGGELWLEGALAAASGACGDPLVDGGTASCSLMDRSLSMSETHVNVFFSPSTILRVSDVWPFVTASLPVLAATAILMTCARA